jgi:hypothetical protein
MGLEAGAIIGIVSAVTTAVGTGVAVYGQRQAAKAAEVTAAYNAQEQKRQAERQTQVAAENARRAEQEKQRYLAAQRAALAKSGLAMEGTPLAVLGETAQSMELEILDLGSEAAARRRALMAGASLSLYEGSARASALRTQSIATGLEGFSGAASGYADSAGLIAPKQKSYLGS